VLLGSGDPGESPGPGAAFLNCQKNEPS